MKNKKLLKLCLFYSTVMLLLFTLSFSVNATSGCCSGHGGVNCDAGPDSDGSVICNDGWKDSSCSYSSMSKCALPSKSSNIRSGSSNNRTNSSSSNTINTQRGTKPKSFMEKHPVLGPLLGISIAVPVIPLGIVGMIINLFSRK